MRSCGMILLQSFVKLDRGDQTMLKILPQQFECLIGVQAILRFHLINLKRSNVGITNGRDLRITPLRWT
jgi:hypothetical protein